MMVRRLLLPVIAGCAVLAFAAPASATPPEKFHFSDSGSEPGFIQCDGFAVDQASTDTRDVTVFFDESGQVVRFSVRGRVAETFTNSVTGKTLVNRGVFRDFFTRIDDTDEFTHSVVGFDFMATSPGEGIVLQDVGRKVFSPDGEVTVFLAGQHIADEEFGDLVCAALS